MAKLYVYTDKGWMDYDNVFTPITGKIKKNSSASSIKVSEEMTTKLKNELSMVFVRRNSYLIQSIS